MNRKHIFLFTLLAAVASAAPVSFTNRASWQSALGAPVAVDNLRGIAATGDSNVLPSLVRGGITFTPGSGTQLVAADQDAPGYDFGAPGSLSFQLGFPSSLTLSFAAPLFSFGFDVATFPGNTDTTDLVAVVSTNAGSFRFQFDAIGGGGSSNLSFVGFTSDAAIRSLVLQANGADPAITNLSTAVPEPGAFSLVALAAGLFLLRRRLLS